MDLSIAIIGLSIHVLIWEKLPEWGDWFNWILQRLPAPLAYLYEAWRCPYCFGFWIAMALHALTGMQTIDGLALLSERFGLIGLLLEFLLDGLACALLILVGNLTINGIGLAAIRGFELKQEFKQKMLAQH